MRALEPLPRWMSWLLDFTLLTFPRERRERFRPEILDAFKHTLAEDVERGMARWWVALRMSRDVATSGVREQFSRMRDFRFSLGNPFGSGSFSSDMRSLIRAVKINPGHHTVVVAILAIGIGVTTAVFSILDSSVLRPLPYSKVDRIVSIWPYHVDDAADQQNVAWHNYADIRDGLTQFELLGVRRGVRYTLTGVGEPVVVNGEMIAPDLQQVFDAVPIMGRLLTEEDDLNTASRPILVSHGFWQRVLGGDESVVGRSVQLDGVAHEVVGVLSPDFRTPLQLSNNRQVEFLTTARWYGETNRRGWRRFEAFGVLAEGATIESAQAELVGAYARLAEQYPNENDGRTARLVTLTESVLGDDTEMAWITAVAGFLLLIVAVSNAAGLMLARGFFRRQELTVRTALGATRARLIRQLVTEGAMLGLMAGMLGTVVAYILLPYIVTLLPQGLPRLGEVAVDARILGFAAITSLAVGILSGLAPTIRLGDLASELRGTRGSSSHAHGRLFKAIVVAELAVAVVLMTGGGLLVASFARLADVDSGLSASGAVAFNVRLSRDVHGAEGIPIAFDQVYERLRAVPGVDQVGATWIMPLVGGSSRDSYLYRRDGEVQESSAEFGIVAPGYYAAVGRPVTRGRPFTENDVATSEQVAIVSESFARSVWPEEDPLGKEIAHGRGPWRTVVGVVSDVRHYGLAASHALEYHVPQAQESWPSSMTIVARTVTDPLELVDPLRAAVWEIDDSVALQSFRTIERIIADSISVPRTRALLMAAFALTGLILTIAGVFAIASFMATTRTREIGIRMALGSSERGVVGMFIRDSMKLLAVGTSIGIVVSTLLARYLRGFLFETTSLDPAVIGGTLAVITLAVVCGVLRPAMRATDVDPVAVLHGE